MSATASLRTGDRTLHHARRGLRQYRVVPERHHLRPRGFGHWVYKNFDPRATVIKKACFDVLERLGIHSRLLEIAVELEEITLKDDYFIERRLYPNVDFYSGVIYNAIGIPENMFTALFAVGRLPGWIAHWMEMHADPDFKIGRPRQIYEGAMKRSYVPAAER